jgi:tetratricopeptide (TPR) repeat protein
VFGSEKPSEKAKEHYKQGLSLTDKGEFNEATRELKKAVSISPDFWEAHVTLGMAYYYGESRYYDSRNDAIRQFEKAILIKPDCAEAHLGLGLAFTRRKFYERAIRYTEQALLLKPDLEGARKLLGRLYKNRPLSETMMLR